MPFLGKDWRSSGEQWIKTEQGWERTKVLECILDHINTELKKEKINKHRNSVDSQCLNENEDEDDDDDNFDYCKLDNENASVVQCRKPFVYLNNDSINRENNAAKLTVTEVLHGLDMVGAVKDVRRFNYVCKLVQLIINEKLTQISGNAQRTLFMIVRVMVTQVLNTHENLAIMKKLLIDFKKKLQDSYYYYLYYIGSQQLWEKHLSTINKWFNLLEKKPIQPIKPSTTTNTQINLLNIPNDCKLEIIRRLNTGLDLLNLAKSNKNFNNIINNELAVWKNLCLYHFQQTNINLLLNKTTANENSLKNDISTQKDDVDWKCLYFKLKRRYGHKEVYVDMIFKCFYCKCLFWREIGHHCIIINENEASTEPITPKKLIHILLQ